MRRPVRQARAVGLTRVEAHRFALGDQPLRLLWRLKADGCAGSLICPHRRLTSCLTTADASSRSSHDGCTMSSTVVESPPSSTRRVDDAITRSIGVERRSATAPRVGNVPLRIDGPRLRQTPITATFRRRTCRNSNAPEHHAKPTREPLAVIREARAAGMSLRQIAAVVGLSPESVRKLST